jgi:serine/threonine protein kinase
MCGVAGPCDVCDAGVVQAETPKSPVDYCCGRVGLCILGTAWNHWTVLRPMQSLHMLHSPDVYEHVPGDDAHKDAVWELRAEARTMAMLNHPHIVRFVGVVEEPVTGCPDPVPKWIVMERASTSLEGYLHPADGLRRVLRLHEYTRLLEHVLEALVYLHTLRPHVLVHFDPKPDNVLVFFDPHEEEVVTPVFKLGDFGLSTFLDSLGQLHSEVSVGGAVFYRAPEIGTPHVSTKSDVYSFAVMASKVLLESVAVDGAAPEVADASLIYGMDRHRMLEDAWSRAGLPPQLSMLLRRCGEVDPRERLDSSEALRLLRAFLVETDGRAAALERVSHCPVLAPFIATLPYAILLSTSICGASDCEGISGRLQWCDAGGAARWRRFPARWGLDHPYARHYH